MDEAKVREIIRQELAHFMKQSKFVFGKPIQIEDGNDITLGQTFGTRIGTAATQKIGLYGVSPIAKQTGVLRDINADPRPGLEGYDNYARAACADLNMALTNLGIATI